MKGLLLFFTPSLFCAGMGRGRSAEGGGGGGGVCIGGDDVAVFNLHNQEA